MVVATKADRISDNQLRGSLAEAQRTAAGLARPDHRRFLPRRVSDHDELWRAIPKRSWS